MKRSFIVLALVGFATDGAYQTSAFGNEELCTTVTTLVDEDDGDLLPASGAGEGISLREAVNHSPAGAVITFDQSLASQVIRLSGSQLEIVHDLEIDASALGGGIVIEGRGESRIFNTNATAVCTLRSLTLRGGRAPDGALGQFGRMSGESGGAIFASGTLIMEDCEIRGSFAGSGFDGGRGGGIYSEADLTLTRCIVLNNQSGRSDDLENAPGGGGHGGGIYSKNGTLTISNSLISRNTTGRGGNALPGGLFQYGGNAGHGGGIYKGVGTLTIIDSTISSNRTGSRGVGMVDMGGEGADGNAGSGAGIYCGNSEDSTVSRCTISANSTGFTSRVTSGGGIFIGHGTMAITASTISNNSASSVGSFFSGDQGGGGIYSAAALALDHVTIVSNRGHSGGGVFVPNSDPGAQLILNNSIVAGNIADRDPQDVAGSLQTGSGNNFIGGDPKLSPLADYGGPTMTMLPQPGSPVIDAASSLSTTDQRGFTRDGSPDIGAVEFSASDLGFFWEEDLDADGNNFGIEFAIGTDPNSPDRGSPKNPAPIAGGNGLSYGFNPSAVPAVEWLVYRSTDLINFTEINRTDAAGSTTTAPAVVFTSAGGFHTVTDNVDPGARQVFYRVVARLVVGQD